MGNENAITITISKSFFSNQKFLEAFSTKIITISTMATGSRQVSEPIKYNVVDNMLDSDYWQAPEDIKNRRLCIRL